MKRCNVFKWERDSVTGKLYKAIDYTAEFVKFGINYDDCGEFGPGNYSTAIVIDDGGYVQMPPADMIQFLNPVKASDDRA